ncbi:FAD-binding oxidoreductase [Nocardioides sp.]|uniref:FAD-binding oxidoreductase n=1 Tax=Nocardioides sp. TaxID=35761 RepID=UPI003D0A1714
MPERQDPTLLTGWGGTAPTAAHLTRATSHDVAEVVRSAGSRGLIARGLGRSYGDAAQNAGGAVLAPLPELIDLDPGSGVVRVSAGTSFHHLMERLIPWGFFVPVTPGTRYVSVGGAVAADVHGKNHHRVGSLGNHVVDLDLVTADGQVQTVGPDSQPDLFWATVGGMGLTGVITEVRLRVLPVGSGHMVVRTERLPDLAAVMSRMREADRESTYSVAWIDTLATGPRLGRSVLTTGEHAGPEDLEGRALRHRWTVPGEPRVGVPSFVPAGLIARPTVRAFNELWFRKAPRDRRGEVQPISAFFHPLDGVASWNRLYGDPGFVQYQFVIPDGSHSLMPDLLARIARAGHPSFLAVLKRFGPGNAGLLSFPIEGWTLALDLPTSPGLRALLHDLDREVVAAGGRVYLAKDSRMSAPTLAAMYPRLEEFRRIRARLDPTGVFQSDLSRRLSL